MWPIDPAQILVAVILDVLLGDPRRWPHIARSAGALSTAYERWLTAICSRTVLLGVIFWLLVVGTMLAGYASRIHLLGLVPLAAQFFDARHLPGNRRDGSVAARQSRSSTTRQEDIGAARTVFRGSLGGTRNRSMRPKSAAPQSKVSRRVTTDAVVAPLFWSSLRRTGSIDLPHG